MDDEKEKIKENSSLKNDKEFKYKNYGKKKCEDAFSLQLLSIRFMLLTVIFSFCFYLIQLLKKKKLLETDVYESYQLIRPKNIREIKNLSVLVNIENYKYVHLKIMDRYNKRWEVPREVLNAEYFTRNFEPKEENMTTFNLEIQNSTWNNMTEYEHFYFNLYVKENNESNKDKKIFYSFNTSDNFLFSDNYISFESDLTTDEIYGFGERIHNFKLKEGIYTIWPRDQKNVYDDGKGGKNLYGHQPIGLHKTKYKDLWLGFVFVNTNAQDIRIYKKEENITTILYKTIGGVIDYYIIVDNSPENVIRDIHFLIGKPTMPPFWSLGIHQSRSGYKNFNEFKKIYETYKSRQIPIDTMWLDIEGMSNFKPFTLDQKNFKELPKYIDEVIHKDNGNFVPIVDMGIPYNKDNLNKYTKIGDENEYFIKSGYTQENLMAVKWSGITVFPDFFNPEINKLWDICLDDYYNITKYDGIWLDMNEPLNIQRNARCPGETFEGFGDKLCNINKDLKISYLPGYTGNLNHLTIGSINLNGITYNNEILYNNKPLLSVYQAYHTYYNLKKKEKRPFILTRANSIGSGKFSFHWLGDNFSQNKYIEYSIAGIFNYNIFGIPFTGADICGYNGNANAKLCARWYNIGAFYPFSRNHNSKYSIDQYPWSFGENIEKIIKKDFQYRYSLLRYYYSQLFLLSINEKGSFFRPVMFEFPNDIYSYQDIESKIMLGESILICAFFDNDERDKDFIFPNSHFNLYPSGKNFLNYSIKDSVDLRKKRLSGKLSDLHIFLKGGSIIPFYNIFDKYILNTHYLRQEKINIIINPDHEGNAKGTIIYDFDECDVLASKRYIRMDLKFKNKVLTLKVSKDFRIYNYVYKDNYINKIEIWRINEILDLNNTRIKDGYMEIKGRLIEKKSKKLISFIDVNKNKMIIDLSDSERNNIWNNVSIFYLNKINLN